MDGTFDFDANGRARVIDAPAWSRFALIEVQRQLEELAAALADERISDAEAGERIVGTVSAISARDKLLGDYIVKELKGKSRTKSVKVVLWIAGSIANIVLGSVLSWGYGAVLELISDAVEQAEQSHTTERVQEPRPVPSKPHDEPAAPPPALGEGPEGAG